MMTRRLELIRQDMNFWAQMDFWDRLLKGGVVGRAISRHHRDLEALRTGFRVRFPYLWAF